MADVLKNLFGGAKSAVSSVVSASADDAFADFATAASPAAPSHAATTSFAAASNPPTAVPRPGGIFASPVGLEGRPYTKWYRVWERVTIADFYQEMFIIPLMIVVVLINVIGSRMNSSRAKQWAVTHLPLLESEFAVVGFKKGANKTTGPTEISEDVLRQKGKNEYITYATGRANVAFLDVKLSLLKRYNPFLWIAEAALSFFFDFIDAPVERVEATAVCFDGKEKLLTPNAAGTGNSAFDGFVFAVVHKDKMKALRDERYDLSLTTTRDHPKLPEWATVMSESAEISDALITPELVSALNDCGEDLEALIVSDQPIDAPKKLNDLVPRKRVTLVTKLNPKPSSTRLFEYFLRVPDQLASGSRFRPEALRKVRATREEEQRKIRKLDEDEKAEERRLAGDKMKKEERDRKLGRMSADEQRKFLEKEKETERKKQSKRRTMKG